MKDPLFENYNNETCSEIARNAVKKYMGEEALAKAQPWMACESMQAYLKYWPGVITFTGIQNPEMGTGANHDLRRSRSHRICGGLLKLRGRDPVYSL